MFTLSTANLDWSTKFPIDMSQNKGKVEKVHPVERNLFSFLTINPLFWWNRPKVNNIKTIVLFKS